MGTPQSSPLLIKRVKVDIPADEAALNDRKHLNLGKATNSSNFIFLERIHFLLLVIFNYLCITLMLYKACFFVIQQNQEKDFRSTDIIYFDF